MNYHRLKQKVFVPMLVLPLILGTSSLMAQDTVVDTTLLNRTGEVVDLLTAAGSESQTRINQLSDQADEAFANYKRQADLVDALQVYNAGLRRTIAAQLVTIANYYQSISEIAVLQRQIPPLMERMMTALEQFVALDLPFQQDVRNARLTLIRNAFDNSSVNIAEKFRVVLQEYQTQNTYGRIMNSYSNILPIGGVDRDVDILRVGRIALLYQTSDQTSTGVWDTQSNQWVALPDEYRRPVATGIRMAQQLSSTEILELPIAAPE